LQHFPTLEKWIKKNLQNINLVFFSSTEPGKHLPAHTGNNQGVLRIQIGVDIAEPEKCSLRVEDKIIRLREGETFIFDDTYEHELTNNSNSVRTVLIIDMFKKFPFIYDKINRSQIKTMQKSKYVQEVIKKL